MTSIGEVGEQLNRVLDKAAAAGAALQVAAELAGEAQECLSSVSEGSLQADVAVTNAQFAAVASGTQELHQVLGAGMSGLEAILHRLDLGGRNASRLPASSPSPDHGTLRQVDRLRRQLPPPVQRGLGRRPMVAGSPLTDQQRTRSSAVRASGVAVAKLMVWWDDEVDDGTLVQTPQELVELLTRVNAEAGYPVVLELLDAETPHAGSILDVGLHGDRGALYFSGPGAEDGVYSFNGDLEAVPAERIAFDYMRNSHDFPATAMHPVEDVLRASVEFMEQDGQRPGSLNWQPRPVAGGAPEIL